MRDLTILADDLTGALDAAGAFASSGGPVDVRWDVAGDDRSALDSETRSLQAQDAAARVTALLPFLADGRLALKKIDSLLRGNTFVEIAAVVRSGVFDTMCIAPAFPGQQRTTRGGRLFVAGEKGQSIVEGLQAHGIDAAVLAAGAAPAGKGVFVCDARTDADLDALVHGARGRVLWCGSSGLARALAPAPPKTLAGAAQLVIIGSRHPVSGAHAAKLSSALGPAAVSAANADAAALVARHLRLRGRAALMLDLPDMPPAEAEDRYRAILAQLGKAVDPPQGVIVVGGDTLLRLVQSVGATALTALGEYAPGLPVSHLRGGRWDGCRVISKSGAFADAGLFSEFVHGELKSA